MAGVFGSYSGHDSGFVHELHDAPVAASRGVRVDREDIRPASRWEGPPVVSACTSTSGCERLTP
jgi:hypothetical protein